MEGIHYQVGSFAPDWKVYAEFPTRGEALDFAIVKSRELLHRVYVCWEEGGRSYTKEVGSEPSPPSKKVGDITYPPVYAEFPRLLLIQARCRGLGPRRFFGDIPDNYSHAKKVCAVCPVKDGCLNWAMENNILYGFWGGTSPEDRRTLRHAQAS